ncbi:TadE-like protein [Singulisphaera sp. GP187]|nr:TadE-like protein [Singulisphaera sp. GP187]
MIAPVFITLVLGQIETSRLGMVSQLLTTAAREGCRVAVIPGKAQSDVQNRVNSVLAGSGIPIGAVTPTCPSPDVWDSSSAGTPITVRLSVPYSSVSWLGTPFFLKGATITASATMSSERP